ncbi:helix-turn-helix domain-containing protein [Niabella sp. 22666]|uniref:helix-turn-helix domain-containing protein n=1 Tax=Niabella sp. 22666 TaxID=3453954 RepID=UPI003F83A513
MNTFFGQNLKFLREKNNWKQSQMIDLVGVKASTWGMWENEKSYPNFLDLLKISNYFGVKETELIHSDLSNAHLNEKNGSTENAENAHLNAHPFAHLNSENDHQKLSTKKLETPVIKYEVKEVIRPVMVTVDHQGRENIVMVPVKARAGYLNGYGDPEFVQSLPAYRLPNLRNNVYRMFEVEGLSNYPTLHDKDIVIGSFVDHARLIRDDRMHVVVTKDHGVVIKRVLNRVEKDGKLILKSDNYQDRHLYPPLVLNPEDVLEVWYAEMRLTRQFASTDLYTRLVDLEGRLTLLEAGGSGSNPQLT